MNSFCCFISVVCQTTYRYTDTPRFLDTGQGYNVTVHRGQKAELACKVENIGPKEVGVTEGGWTQPDIGGIYLLCIYCCV